jgi:hypothetical protein
VEVVVKASGASRREIVESCSIGYFVIASAAKQSIATEYVEAWIASRSLSSGARSRDPLARNDDNPLNRNNSQQIAAASD